MCVKARVIVDARLIRDSEARILEEVTKAWFISDSAVDIMPAFTGRLTSKRDSQEKSP